MIKSALNIFFPIFVFLYYKIINYERWLLHAYGKLLTVAQLKTMFCLSVSGNRQNPKLFFVKFFTSHITCIKNLFKMIEECWHML
ncbi:hypothetical protein C5O78_04340 [Treponema phagedenis]|nr:hypothetical protein C5O78_04340 [Treponema phagedenis]